MPWIRDANGEWVWTDEPQVQPQSIPGTQVSVPTNNENVPGFGGETRRPPGGGPANQGIDFSDLGRRIQQAWDVGFPDRRGYEQGGSTGAGVGASAGRHGATYQPPAPLSFGSELLPEDQALLDALRSSGTTITAPQLPEVPAAMFEVDPGLDRLVTHAQNRQTQVDELLAELRAGREDEVNRATNKWVTLGRWLSDWASTGDWGQSGAAMTRALQQNQDMRDELRRETLQYIQMGWSAEDAVIQAQVALLSGQADARRQQAAARYQRDTAQTQLDFSASTANAQNSRGVALAIAEATRDAIGRAREARTQAAQALTGSPQYSRQAFGEIARNVTSDPGTRDALTSTMEEQQLNSALMGIVAQYAGSQDSAARRQGLQILRQWDPTLNDNALRNSTPQQLMLRLTRTPQARAAFEANREYLIRSQQFGGMMQPAQ